MHRKFYVGVGALANLVLLSMPLLAANVKFSDFALSPVSWAYYALLTVFCLLESNASYLVEDGPLVRKEKSILPYLVGLIVLAIFWVSILEYAGEINDLSCCSIIPCAFIALGIFLRVTSIKTLNRFFISHIGLINNHRLIVTGIYSIVRHPSEAGLLLICVGVPILLSSLTGLWLAGLLLFPLTMYRVRLEDKMLLARFPQEFSLYKASTPALFPRITGCLANRNF